MPLLWKTIEESSLQTWPSLHSNRVGGWHVRISDGYSKRSNSVSTLDYIHTDIALEDQIGSCEAVYHKAELPVVFKMTPFTQPSTLDQQLHLRHYQIQDETSVQCRSLLGIDGEYEQYKASIQEKLSQLTYTIEEQWSEVWVQQASLLGEWSDTTGHSIAKLMSVNTLPKAYMTVYDNEQPVACVIGVIDGEYIGIYDVITGASYRRQGIAKMMLYHLMKWAQSQGVSYSYLQVGEHNQAAMKLYAGLGFEEVYRYWYRVLLEK